MRSTRELDNTAKRTSAARGARARSRSRPAIERFTVNRSRTIDKMSREQYEMRTHKRLLEIVDPTPADGRSADEARPGAGVDVEIKL
jgi:small subunit ribosomal protein S10